MADRKLKSWVEAGLIDTATAERIDAWEASHSRPIALWALIGLGALAIGLGLISVVAANWDAIPGQFRLSVHFLIMIAVAAVIWWRAQNIPPETDYFHDALLFIFGALTLTFFGHVGQVYQTTSPLWQPLLAWTLLLSPLLLLSGRSWPAAALWMAGVVVTSIAHASVHGFGYSFGTNYLDPEYPVTYWGLIATPPMFAAALAAWARGKSKRKEFWRLVEQLAIIVIISGISFAIILRVWPEAGEGNEVMTALFHAAALGVLALAIYAARQTKSGRATAGILLVAAVMHVIAVLGAGTHIIPALAFMLLWASIALASVRAEWRVIFQIAIALLALRLIILSFELAYDLLFNGIGLIMAGIATLSIAWLAVRVSRKYAPEREKVG